MAKVGSLVPIEILPGVQPITDQTAVTTQHFTFTDKVRFRNGKPEKIGGRQSIEFDYNEEIDGYARSLYTEFINGKYYTVIGTHKKLYSLIGTRINNITPLLTTSIAASNSVTTQYNTLANNPISATAGEMFVWVSDTQASRFEPGDIVYLSGAMAFAGITAPALSGDFIVREIGVNQYKIYVGEAATSTATGGGASVVRSSGLINIASTAHGNMNGDRVKLEGATDTGGILASQINSEFIIRNSQDDSFDVMTIGDATSAVTGGGASFVYYEEIPDGMINETNSQGYGAGLYGIGLYGTALESNSSRQYPRIWFDDRYGDTITLTPGEQTGLYQWLGSAETAPAIIENSPSSINYQFVSDNIIVTFGAGDIENRIYASDQNNITEWTSSSINQVYDDDIEGAGRLTSHCPVEDYNLIFTEFKTYKFRYIGLPFVWEVTPVDETIGIIAPMARVSVKGMAFWMGSQNFYMYRGGTVEIIPANSQNQSTCLQYVFDNINWGQKSKCFAWYNKQFNEVWFHYPSADSNEPDRIVRVNLIDYTWSIDTGDYTAAEYPNVKLVNPRMVNIGTLYKTEIGTDDDGQALPFRIDTNNRFYGKDTANQLRIYPDSRQTGDIIATVTGYLAPQSIRPMYSVPYTVSPDRETFEQTNNGRFYKISITGSELGQIWEMGTWFEEVQKGPSE